MTDYSVNPICHTQADDPAVLRTRLEELEQRNAELEATTAPGHRSTRGALRTAAVVVLITLGAVVVTASVPTIWGRNLVLNTARYVETLQPLASNPGVQ